LETSVELGGEIGVEGLIGCNDIGRLPLSGGPY